MYPGHLSPSQSRRRAALSALRAGKQVVVGFNAAQSNQIVDMRECPLLRPDLFALVAPIRALLGTIAPQRRSEEHTSELQSLMSISYAVFCLKKKMTS